MEQKKKELQKKIEDYRYGNIKDELYDLLEEFIRICEEDKDDNSLIAGHFYKGELFFRKGDYADAITELEICLSYKSNDSGKEFQANAYNVLGLIYAFLGCEIIALEYYLEGLELAKNHNFYRIQTILYINVGWLYKEIDAFDEAMENYNNAILSANQMPKEHHYNLKVLCYSYIGQIYCRNNEYSMALELLNNIYEIRKKNNILFYDVSLENFEIRVYDYLNNEKKVAENIGSVLKRAESEEDFIEFCEFYLDVCSYMMEKGKQVEARKLLDSLHMNAGKLDLTFINMKIQAIECQYHRLYSSHDEYLTACGDYMSLSKQYDVFIKKSMLSGMRIIEELRRIEKEKEHYEEISRLDGMTGIYNKHATEYYIKEYLEIYSPIKKAGLILIDIDNFKMVNDNYGHLIGDSIIKSVATTLAQIFRSSDIVGRVGGDEFLVLMKHVKTKEEVIEKAEELRNTLEKMFVETQEHYNISVSVGVSMIEDCNCEYGQLFSKADHALYEAKNAGRNQVVIG